MGKPEEVGGGGQTAPDTLGCWPGFGFWNISSWHCIITLLLTLSLLAFVILSIPLYSRSTEHASQALTRPPTVNIQASFSLRRPFSVLNSSLLQLESELQGEIGIPNIQVRILSLLPLRSENWTEVVFAMVPDHSSVSLLPAYISLLRETFVELFLGQSVNLSLSMDTFGKAYNYEILSFPAGITVFPEQSGFPLELVVLFNFTLSNSLSTVVHNFAQFKEQLALGIDLKMDECLFLQLTNLNGSTLKQPLIIQTSIMPVVGLSLPIARLKQLAQEIIASPRRNLGLSHTLFGSVRGIKLSSYLAHTSKPVITSSAILSSSPSVSPFCSLAPEDFKHHGSPLIHMPAPGMLPCQHDVHHHKAEAPISDIFSAPQHHHSSRPLLFPNVDPCFQPSPVSLVNPYVPAPSTIHVSSYSSAPVAALTTDTLPRCPKSSLSPHRGFDNSRHQFEHPSIFSNGLDPTSASVSPVLHACNRNRRESVSWFLASSSVFALSLSEWTLVVSVVMFILY